MKIPLKLLNVILETVRQNEGILREGRDRIFKFDLLEDTETADTHAMKIIEAYYDYKDGWVLDTKEQSE